MGRNIADHLAQLQFIHYCDFSSSINLSEKAWELSKQWPKEVTTGGGVEGGGESKEEEGGGLLTKYLINAHLTLYQTGHICSKVEK